MHLPKNLHIKWAKKLLGTWIFRIVHKGKSVWATPYDTYHEKNGLGIPTCLKNKLDVKTGDTVHIQPVLLPKVKDFTLEFFEKCNLSLAIIKNILVKIILAQHKILEVGDIITPTQEGKDYPCRITKTNPGEVVYTPDSSPIVHLINSSQ